MDDPTADFLARERSILGNEADMFGQMSDIPSTSVLGNVNDMSNSHLFSNTADLQPGTEPWANTTSITTTTAAVNLPLPTSPSHIGASVNDSPTSNLYQTTTVTNLPQADTESMIQWRAAFSQKIAERDAGEERLKQEAVRKAKESIDQFYEDYNAKRDRALAESKASQETRMATMNSPQSGPFWEQVSKYIELVGSSDADSDSKAAFKDKSSTKRPQSVQAPNANAAASLVRGKDITRFKQVLLTLKSTKA